MAIVVVACPNCRTALKSSRAVPAGKTVRCPGCGTQFTVSADLTPPPEAPVVTEPLMPPLLVPPLPPPARPVSVGAPAFLAAVVAAILFGSVLIAGAIYLALQRPGTPDSAPRAAAEGEEKQPRVAARDADAEGDLLAERQKREEAERENRKLAVAGLVAQGQLALAKKDLGSAEKAFREALKLEPDHSDAADGLADVKVARIPAKQEEGEAVPPAKVNADQEANRKEMEEARAQGDDKAEQKKQADYQAALKEGKAHLTAGRLTDAIRLFTKALDVMPGDKEASRGKREAEGRIAAQADRDKRDGVFQATLERSRLALAAKRYQEAVDEAGAALRIYPDDNRARQQARVARETQKKAKADYNEVLAQANTALKLGRVEEAYKLFGDASRLMPEEKEPNKGREEAERGVETMRLGQAAYERYMIQARAAAQTERYLDAVTAYTEALRLVPNDAMALRELRDVQVLADRIVRRAGTFNQAMTNGAAALKTRQYADATRYFTEALRASPDDPRALAGLNQARYNRFLEEGKQAQLVGRRNDAIKAYQSALEVQPGDANVNFLLRQVLAMPANGKR